jgi:hypothetical protein
MADTITVNLEQFRKYVKESKYDEFAADFENTMKERPSALFLSGNKLIGRIVEPEAAKEMLYQELRKKVLERPETIKEIIKSLEGE